MKTDKMDNLLKTIIQDDIPSGICEIDDISIPDLNSQMKNFKVSLSSSLKNNDKGIFRRYIVPAACILLCSLVLSILYEVPPIRAIKSSVTSLFIKVNGKDVEIKEHYRPNTEKRSDKSPENTPPEHNMKQIKISIEDAVKRLPFHLAIPGYLPSGYELASLECYEDKDQNLDCPSLVYTDTNGGYLIITEKFIKGDFASTHHFNTGDQAKVSKIKILGTEATLLLSPDICNASWVKDKVSYDVTSNMPEAEFTKLLQNIK